MSFISNLVQGTQKLITKKVVESKLTAYFNNMEKASNKAIDSLETTVDKVEESTGLVAEAIDTVYKLWVRMTAESSKGIMIGVRRNQPKVVDLVSNNIDSVQSIIASVEKLITDDNKTLLKEIYTDIMASVNKETERLSSSKIIQRVIDGDTPRVVTDIMDVWNYTHKYYIMIQDEKGKPKTINVTEDRYSEHIKQYEALHGEGSFKAQVTTWSTRQTEMITSKKKTTKEFYNDLGVSDKAVDTIFPNNG